MCLALVVFLSMWGHVGQAKVYAASVTSDVTFTYPHFPLHMQADLFEMVVFSVMVHIQPPATGAMPSGTFQWRRNGENWTEPGGSGNLQFDSFGSAEVHLVLRDGLSHEDRGGTWYLRVSFPQANNSNQNNDQNNDQNNNQNNNQAGGTEPLIRRSREAVLTIVDGRLLWTPPPPPMPVWPPPPPTPAPTPAPTPPYAAFGNLDGIIDTPTAVEAVRQAFLASTPQDLAGGMLELFAEAAIKRSATQHANTMSLTINSANLAHLVANASLTRISIESLFAALNYHPQRSLRTGVVFSGAVSGNHSIILDPSAAGAGVDFIWVQTPDMEIGITREFLSNNVANQAPLTINFSSRMERVLPHAPMLLLMPDPVELIGVPTVTPPPPRAPVGPAPPLWRPGMSFVINPALQDIAGGWVEMRTYQVDFSRTVTDPLRLSVAPIEGARAFQVVRDINSGSIQNTRTNRVTGTLDARVRVSGNFAVVHNEVSFADTHGLSAEMQMAIQNLASQGILHGFNRLEFRPHEPITRAQAASIISRMLGIYDTNANGGFTDVRRGDWYFGAVGSVRRAELMLGLSPTLFGPGISFPKDQLVVLSGRILRQEMRYHIPPNPHGIVQQQYADWANLHHWSINDIALANRLNLVVPRADGFFAPSSVLTRGEVALIMHRMYLRLW